MPALVSVLVPTRDPGPGLNGLVASLDAQSAPLADFEVVFADATSADGTPARLARLSGSRPNVRVVGGPADADDHQLVGLALAEASGRYVLVLPQEERLTRDVVALVAAAAGTESAPEVVLGRRGSSGDGDGAAPVDRTGVAAGPGGPAPLLALRRDVVLGLDDPAGALTSAGTALERASTVVALGAHAGLVAAYEPPAQPAVTLSGPAYGWQDGAFEVGVELTGAPADLRAWLVLATVDGSTEIAAPAGLEQAGGAVSLRAAVDPRTADGGGPLAEGVWQLRLRLIADGVDQTLPLPPRSAASAVLDGAGFVPIPAGAGQQLDVHATRTSAVNRVSPDDASVVESARGSLLTLRYPRLHVQGDAVAPAAVLFGGFRLPARLVCTDGAAQVECWASGLSGRSTLSVLVGQGRPTATGLDLTISETGTMALSTTPPPAKAAPAPAAPPAAPAPVQQRPQVSDVGAVVQTVRRHLPGFVEPVARRLAAVGPVRRVYRAIVLR